MSKPEPDARPRAAAARSSDVAAAAAVTQRFTGRSADYRRARPTYPAAFVDVVEQRLGVRPGDVVADIGAGTGLSAEPFVRQGHTVIGIDPNAEMLAVSVETLRGSATYRGVVGRAENTGLAGASVDCVIVAQAFHWLERDAARREFRRILRPPRRAAIAWHARRTRGSAFLEAYEALLREHGTDYDTIRQRTESAMRSVAADAAGDDAFFGDGCERVVLDNFQDLDLDALRRRVRSSSYMPAAGEAGHAAMMRAVDALFHAHAHDGVVRIAYDLDVYLGRL
jgi:SAM-dependent methyltransferase